MNAVTGFWLFWLTAAAEIAGCYAVYAWWRNGGSAWWLAPGAALLALFAWLLCLHPVAGAGRVYAAYGGIYIAASLLWLWLVEEKLPNRWDVAGGLICLIGAAVIYFAPRVQ